LKIVIAFSRSIKMALMPEPTYAAPVKASTM
jgi:hypothetical protein